LYPVAQTGLQVLFLSVLGVVFKANKMMHWIILGLFIDFTLRLIDFKMALLDRAGGKACPSIPQAPREQNDNVSSRSSVKCHRVPAYALISSFWRPFARSMAEFLRHQDIPLYVNLLQK